MDTNLRIAHNYLMQKTGGNYQYQQVLDAAEFLKFAEQSDTKSYKVALLFICLNPNYWQYIRPAVEGAKRFFLPGHEVDHFIWSDLPLYPENDGLDYGAKKIFPTEPIEWPMPTLYRYHTFLQQEEILKDYDYIYYCDVDMQFVNVVGDEILGDLVGAQHPMYALKKNLWPPYEPNKDSKAYIPRPGTVFDENGKPRFMPLYFAGGFQGGKADKFIEAMKVMRDMIDEDMKSNYMAIWNDESHWNRYLFDNPPTVVLTPSYVYPDSLHKEYYIPIWGTDYPPKIVTLTKKFSLQKLNEEEQKQLTQNL